MVPERIWNGNTSLTRNLKTCPSLCQEVTQKFPPFGFAKPCLCLLQLLSSHRCRLIRVDLLQEVSDTPHQQEPQKVQPAAWAGLGVGNVSFFIICLLSISRRSKQLHLGWNELRDKQTIHGVNWIGWLDRQKTRTRYKNRHRGQSRQVQGKGAEEALTKESCRMEGTWPCQWVKRTWVSLNSCEPPGGAWGHHYLLVLVIITYLI